METNNIVKISRNELIDKISKEFINIRKEAKLTQDDIANILGISKNTIVSVEKNGKPLSWAVVMATVLLFSQTTPIMDILNGVSPLEVITHCAFLDADNSKNGVLYNSTISRLSSISVGAIAGGVLGSALYGLLNKNNK